MVWDGTRWVTETPTTPASSRSTAALRNWLATGIMIVVIGAVVVPFIGADAGAVTLTTSPSSGVPGDAISVAGRRFLAGSTIQLTWDGSASGMPKGQASSRGRISLTMIVPSSPVGPHSLAAILVNVRPVRGGARSSIAPITVDTKSPIAQTTFAVVSPGAVFTPFSTSVAVAPAPTDGSTPAPTDASAPGPFGASTPAPAEASAPAATGASTPAPTEASAPAPTGATAPIPTSAATPIPDPPTDAPVVVPTSPPPPVATPNPTPKPTPKPTPTPAPAGSVVEFTGDSSGGTDVSSAITSFLNSNKGKTVGFKAGATYRVDNRIQVSAWTGTIQGRGATFRRFATDSGRDSILRLVGGNGIRIENLNLRGPATISNVTNWTSWSRETEHALFIDSGKNITVVGGSFTNTWGDGIYMAERDNSSYGIPDGIVLDGVVLDTNGRNGVGVVNARNITLKNCKSSRSGLTGFDAEPNSTSDVIDNITIRNCEFRTFNLGNTPSSSGSGYAIQASAGATGSSDVVIDGNWFDRGQIFAVAPSGHRNARITITNNSAAAAGVATIGRTDNLVFSGNSNITKQIVAP